MLQNASAAEELVFLAELQVPGGALEETKLHVQVDQVDVALGRPGFTEVGADVSAKQVTLKYLLLKQQGVNADTEVEELRAEASLCPVD